MQKADHRRSIPRRGGRYPVIGHGSYSEEILSAAQPAAATHAAPDNGRRNARAERDSADAPRAEETLCEHAKRSLRTNVGCAVTRVLDPVIASLQRLRERAGGPPNAGKASDDENRPRSSRARDRHNAAPADAEQSAAPKPKRRLHAAAVYLAVLLAGGVGGVALAYDYFEELLAEQQAETNRVAETIAEHEKSSAAAEKAVKEAQAKRAEAEQKLAAALAEHERATAAQQKRLEEAQSRLSAVSADRRASGQDLAPPVRTARAPKSANCALSSNNVAALKDCLAEFNRQ
jgi:hypothetical protein